MEAKAWFFLSLMFSTWPRPVFSMTLTCFSSMTLTRPSSMVLSTQWLKSVSALSELMLTPAATASWNMLRVSMTRRQRTSWSGELRTGASQIGSSFWMWKVSARKDLNSVWVSSESRKTLWFQMKKKTWNGNGCFCKLIIKCYFGANWYICDRFRESLSVIWYICDKS